jgi:hypothetical protein
LQTLPSLEAAETRSASSQPTRARYVSCWLIWACPGWTVGSWRSEPGTSTRALFAAAERLDLEGIVAKRKVDPYAPGTVWYKVKNRAYTEAEGRGDLFHRSR